MNSDGSTLAGAPESSSSTFCSVTTSRLYNSEVGPKYNASRISIAADSLLVSTNAGDGKATDTYGNVGLVHGTCAYSGPLGSGSLGIGTGAAVVPPFHAPQYFSTSGRTCSGSHVPGDDDRRVLGPVPTLEEHLRVRVLVGHVLDVPDEAHRRVLVGVGLVEAIALHFVQLLGRIGRVPVVFAEDRPRFGLEIGFRHRQVLKHVRVETDDRFQLFFGECRVVACAIVAGAGIVAGPGFAHHLTELRGRRVRRPPEHQMLEEMREARLARLDFVARPDLHGDLNADQIGKSGRHDDHLQAVGERGFGGRERQDVAGRRTRRRGHPEKHYGQNGQDDQYESTGTSDVLERISPRDERLLIGRP